MAEELARQVKTSLEDMVHELDKNNLRPAQKQHFLCSAKCCDSAGYGEHELQRCLQKCGEPVMVMEHVINTQITQFQERLQRCMVRCQDMAQDKLPAQPSEKQIAAAQGQMESCVMDCARQYIGQIPKLKTDIQASLKRL